MNLPGKAQWQPVLAQLVSNRESLPNYTVLKYSRTGEVFRAQLAVGDRPLDVIGKQSRVYRRGWRMVLPFAQTREARNFDRALTLLRAGINTALPLAVLERRSPKREAWLITEFVPGLVDLDQVALGRLPQSEVARLRKIKNALIDAVVDLLEALERAGLVHRDFKASNILLKDWDSRSGPPSVWLVDLDGLQHVARWNTAKRWQPVVRLAASLLGYTSVTRTDYGRFLRAYLNAVTPHIARGGRIFTGSRGRRVSTFAARSGANPTNSTATAVMSKQADFLRPASDAGMYGPHDLSAPPRLA